MRRALYLATLGKGRVSPNPMVGAVIVADDKIIGEGFHRTYGEWHAERNAVFSVRKEDIPLLEKATMYVTLEPCTHYGKTPPCSELIIERNIPRVVIGSLDPFLESRARGTEMLEKAGVEVTTGLLKEECDFLNRRFLTAHRLKRPFVMLKWAQTADGYMGAENRRLKISNPLSEVMMHRERADFDAIMVGVDTVIADNPRLNCRLWPTRDCGTRPIKVSFDSPRIPQESNLAMTGAILKGPGESLEEFLARLYREHGITSLMVEGGAKTLQAFLESGIYDEIRVETSSERAGEGITAPCLEEYSDTGLLVGFEEAKVRDNTIKRYVDKKWLPHDTDGSLNEFYKMCL